MNREDFAQVIMRVVKGTGFGTGLHCWRMGMQGSRLDIQCL